MSTQGSHSEVSPEGTPKAVSRTVRRSLPESWLVPGFQVAGLGALLPFLLSFLSPWLMIAELAVNFQVQWFWGLFCSAIVLLLLRRWWSGAVLLCTAAVAASSIIPIYLPDPNSSAQPGGPSLRIMSFNVLGSNRSHADAIAEIRRFDPDLLVIVEYTLTWEQALASLKSDYPHVIEQPRWHGFGIALFSKLPLQNPETIATMPLANELPVVRATIDFAGRPLEVVGLHLINPIGEQRWRLRSAQFSVLAEQLGKSSAERVILGDFNCTDWSSEFRKFLRTTGLRDSRQGFGIFPSWSPQGLELLSIPIDHALVSAELAVHARTVGEKSGSDHRPVIIDLGWKREPKPDSR